MLMFTLAISSLITSNLPWFIHSRFLCNTALYSIGPCFHHQSHPQLGVVFALPPSLHSFWSYFSTDLLQHIGYLPTWGDHLSVSYLFAFSYCSWGSQGKNAVTGPPQKHKTPFSSAGVMYSPAEEGYSRVGSSIIQFSHSVFTSVFKGLWCVLAGMMSKSHPSSTLQHTVSLTHHMGVNTHGWLRLGSWARGKLTV